MSPRTAFGPDDPFPPRPPPELNPGPPGWLMLVGTASAGLVGAAVAAGLAG